MVHFSMIQQQQTRNEHCADRPMMMQIMTMTMAMMQMQMIRTNRATQNDAINERLNTMTGNLASQTMTVEPNTGPPGGTEQLDDKGNENSND